MSMFTGGDYSGRSGRQTMPLLQTIKLAWADTDIRNRIIANLVIFAIYALGINVSVPIPGHSANEITQTLQNNAFFILLNTFGGGALSRLSVFALGLNPYITAAIIFQVLQQAIPSWKEEMKEGGEYAKQAMNKRIRIATVILCIAQSFGYIQLIRGGLGSAYNPATIALIILFWTAGATFVLWLGEQINEYGIGNGVSLMIFAGIIISMPYVTGTLFQGVLNHVISWFSLIGYIVLFLLTTWIIVYVTVAQRRIPIQHMRRMQGTKQLGGQTSYLPLSVNMTGVIPIIFAITLIFMPAQFSTMVPAKWWLHSALEKLGTILDPGRSGATIGSILLGSAIFVSVIFFFTYFYTAIQYNVDDIADNLKRQGSFIPGIRPGKQTGDFLNGVISRITVVGATFLSAVTLIQFLAPRMVGLTLEQVGGRSVIGGTTLLILVQVALDTMMQIEANVLMKRYGN